MLLIFQGILRASSLEINFARIWRKKVKPEFREICRYISLFCPLRMSEMTPISLIDQHSRSSEGNACQYICYLLSSRNPAAAVIFERILWCVSWPASLRCSWLYTHIPIRWTSLNAASCWNRKSFSFLAMAQLCDAKFQFSVEDRESSWLEAFLVSPVKLAGLICLK